MCFISSLFGLGFIFNSYLFAQSGPKLDEVYSVNKKSYLRQFHDISQKEFCESESVFQKCFLMTEKECQSAVNSSLAVCADRFRIPSSVNIHSNGPVWGQKLGECMGAEIYRKNQKKLSNSIECQRRDAWK
jgi:hypothetical protein